MSTSTLPKSVQAQNNSLSDDISGTSNQIGSQDRRQHYRDFMERLNNLPEDFLRIPSCYYPQSNNGNVLDHSQAAGRASGLPREPTPLVDMLDISVVEAQLVKNYGLLRMDLYCKIRVGHMVCETQTCLNGAKNPKWDGVYQFGLKPGIDSFHLEVYDEKQFSLDEKIAWLYEPIPQEVFQGITVERWFPLSGRLGPNKEGSILLVLSHKRVPMRASNFSRPAHTHGRSAPPLTIYVPAANQGPVVTANPSVGLPSDPNGPYVQSQQQMSQVQSENVVQESRPVMDEDVDQLSEMFPSIAKAVIRNVLENHNNDKEASIGALLALG